VADKNLPITNPKRIYKKNKQLRVGKNMFATSVAVNVRTEVEMCMFDMSV